MNTENRERLSPLQRLVEELFSRLRLAGLMAAFYSNSHREGEEKNPGQLSPTGIFECLGDVLSLVGAVNDFLELGIPLSQGIPYIYNTVIFSAGDPWASSGEGDGVFSLSKIVSGYGSLWTLQVDKSPAAVNKIIKAVVWTAERHGSLRQGMNYLFSLNRAGFLCRSSTLGAVMEKLASLYARTDNFAQIKTLPFSDEDQMEADRLVEGLDQNKLNELGACLLDETLRSIRDCKQAQTYTEWTACRAVLCNLVRASRGFERRFDCTTHWPLPFQAQFGCLEEIDCDLRGPMFLFDCEDLEKSLIMRARWSMTSAVIIMQKSHGWSGVRRTLGSRVLLPDCLLPVAERIAEATNDFAFEDELPLQWQRLGKEICHVMSIMKNLDLPLVRWDPILREKTQKHVEDESATGTSPTDGNHMEQQESTDSTMDLKGEDTEVIALAHAKELSELSHEYISAGLSDASQGEDSVQKILSLYPFNAPYLLERAIWRDGGGSPELALEDLIEAICLNPEDNLLWQSFGVVSERLGHGEDSAIASLIRRVLEDKKSGPSNIDSQTD